MTEAEADRWRRAVEVRAGASYENGEVGRPVRSKRLGRRPQTLETQRLPITINGRAAQNKAFSENR